MKRFLAIYLGSASALAQWKATDEHKRKEQEQAGMDGYATEPKKAATKAKNAASHAAISTLFSYARCYAPSISSSHFLACSCCSGLL
jgi:hypothetical protein